MPDKPDQLDGQIVPFPQSRVPKPGAARPVRELGMTKLAKQIDAAGRGPTGHWCSRCRGVWYGGLAEVECPVCGNRQG